MSRLDLLRGQFDLTWSLCDHHLQRLEPDDALWEPVSHCWTVHLGTDDRWWPDWADTEPDPVPVPTIAWLSWHLGWWWSVTIEHVQGHAPRRRHEVSWPGDAAGVVEWLRALRGSWLAVLDGLTDADLDSTLGERRADEEHRRDRPAPAAAVRGASVVAPPSHPSHQDRSRPAATLADVRITECGADLRNLRMARAAFLLIEHSVLRGADLYSTTAADSALLDCDLTGATVDDARLPGLRLHGSNVDDLCGVASLRGARIGADQLVPLGAALLAAHDIAVSDRN